MALVEVNVASAAPVTQGALAAPTTSETITAPTWNTLLELEVGATATTITIPRPGTNAEGDTRAPLVIGPLTSTRRVIRIHSGYMDLATKNATVLFSQVVGVLTRLWRT